MQCSHLCGATSSKTQGILLALHSRITPGGEGDHIGYQGSNLGLLHTSQVPSPLCYCFGPKHCICCVGAKLPNMVIPLTVRLLQAGGFIWLLLVRKFHIRAGFHGALTQRE